MEITINTPALLFPAISLLLLAYTNRFLAIANLIRGLHSKYKNDPNDVVMGQLKHLRMRIVLIRNMQALGVSSLLLCVFCMFLLFFGQTTIAHYVFGTSLILLMSSLGISVREIQISIDALNIQLSDLEEFKEGKRIIENVEK